MSNSNLRVLHIVPSSFGYTFAGQTHVILGLLRNWSIEGIELDLIGTKYYLQDINPGIKKDELWDSNVKQTKSIRLLWALKLWWDLIAKRNSYDLLHVHVLWWGGLLVPVLAHVLNKKAVYLASLEGSDNPSAVIKENLGWIKLLLYKQFDGVIGLSPSLVNDCLSNKFHSNLLVLPNFIAIEGLFASPSKNETKKIYQEFSIPENAPVILFVGSMILRKGVDVVAEVFSRIILDIPTARLLLVGPKNSDEKSSIDDEFVKRIETMLEARGVSDKVIWTGIINDTERLASLFHSAAIFLFPTRAEGLGNVILEAMAASKPVIVTRLEGVTDLMVKPGENGFLVDIDDIDGFAAVTLDLLRQPDLCKQLGVNGRKLVESEYSFEAYCEKLAGFYHTVNKP